MDKTLILFVLGILLFASPLVHWWASAGLPWFLPYVLWACFIALIALLARQRDGV